MTENFSAVSPNGVEIPDPPVNLVDYDADSPARRSPNVRAAQRLGSRRPDRLPKQPGDDLGTMR